MGRSGYLVWANARRGARADEARAARPIPSRSRRRICFSSCRSGRSLLALDLGAVHDAAAVRVECIAPMHGAAVVPHDEVTDAPHMLPCELRAIHKLPQLVEEGFRLRNIEPNQIGVAAPSQIEHAPTGRGMGANKRMHG